ncbi:hypothetical protein EDC02_1362 [Micromonospora sp. Llam0]|nr:hypothetical protein EDC02_1362 [Micromonospora sp. Llam0]
MIGHRLLTKSRRAVPLLLTLVIVAAVSRELAGQHLIIGTTTPIPLPWAAVLPAITAYLTTIAIWSTLPLQEHLAVRRVDRYDLFYLTAAAAVGVGLVAWAAQPVTGTITAPGAIRNYLGLLGYTLIGTTFFHTTMGWTIPTTLLTTGLVTAGAGIDLPPLDWPARHDTDPSSWAAAITILVAGVATYANPTRRRVHARRAAHTPPQ